MHTTSKHLTAAVSFRTHQCVTETKGKLNAAMDFISITVMVTKAIK